ncbi:MAG: hypothetical protein IJ523_06510 [Succinivibrionaceae bacterium]|nr:hypothetical protein [Succinivibrionaceae bacterium]
MFDMPGHCRCPSCSGNMEYVIATRKLTCGSCGRLMDPEDYENTVRQKEDIREGSGRSFVKGAEINQDEGAESVTSRTYTCSSCGGQISVGALRATTRCPFCDNDLVFLDKYHDQCTPDLIGPFTWDKQQFMFRWQKEINETKYFVPDRFLESLKVMELTPMYVPFWLYDVTAAGTVFFQLERVQAFGSGKNRRYRHEVFNGSASGVLGFSRIPQDATTEMDDDISQALEPYDMEATRPFSLAYLSGQDARIFNMDEHSSFRSAKKRVSDTVGRYLSGAHGYTYYKIISTDCDIHPVKVQYALLPIWYMRVRWESKHYRIAMNGQSGKFVCEVPVSRLKMYSYLLGISLIFWPISIIPLIHMNSAFNHGGKDNPTFFISIAIAALFYFCLSRRFVIRLFSSNAITLVFLLCASLFALLMWFMKIGPLIHSGIRGYEAAIIVHSLVTIAAFYIVRGGIYGHNRMHSMHYRMEADQYGVEEECKVDKRRIDLAYSRTTGSGGSMIGGQKAITDSERFGNM